MSADPPSRWFYLHVMKTAGGSFARLLRAQFARSEVYPQHRLDRNGMRRNTSIPYLMGLPAQRHDQIRAYTGHFPHIAAVQLDPTLLTVTILREPVARTISHLKHRAEGERRDADRSLDKLYEDDIDFVRMVMHNHQVRFFCWRPGEDRVRSFYDPVVVDRERIEIAKENLASVDVVGLTERYDELVAYMCSVHGWRYREHPRVHVSGAFPEPSQALLDRIAEDNQGDLELYAFAEELYRQRKEAGAGP